MSLNSVVNSLVRAAAGIPSDITDAELDAHVAKLLAEEAKTREVKWGELGLGGLLGTSKDSPDPHAPKPNKRFLASVIRTVDGHNTALINEQSKAARGAREDRYGADERTPPRRSKTAGGGASSRLFGGAMRGLEQDERDRSKRRRREEDEDWRDRRERERSRSRSRDRTRARNRSRGEEVYEKERESWRFNWDEGFGKSRRRDRAGDEYERDDRGEGPSRSSKMYGYSDSEEPPARKGREEAEDVDEEAVLNGPDELAALERRSKGRSRERSRDSPEHRSRRYEDDHRDRGPRSKRDHDEEYERRYREKRRERRRREREERERGEMAGEDDEPRSRRGDEEGEGTQRDRAVGRETRPQRKYKESHRGEDDSHRSSRRESPSRFSRSKRREEGPTEPFPRERRYGRANSHDQEDGNEGVKQRDEHRDEEVERKAGRSRHGDDRSSRRISHDRYRSPDRSSESTRHERKRTRDSPERPKKGSARDSPERPEKGSRNLSSARQDQNGKRSSRPDDKSPSDGVADQVAKRDLAGRDPDGPAEPRSNGKSERNPPSLQLARDLGRTQLPPSSKASAGSTRDVAAPAPRSPPPPPPSDMPPSPPPPSPPPASLSKMDRYFDNTYDPRLDLGEVPAEGMIAAVGWDNMLAVIKERGRKPKRSLSPQPPSLPSHTLLSSRSPPHSPSRSPSPTTLARRAARKARKARQAAEASGADMDLALQSDGEKERARRKEKRRKEKEKLASFGKSQRVGALGEDEYAYVPKGGIREWDLGK